ncbi:MAG TPA: ABC transporter permease [Candidatus Acidoferrales bacterium]
MNSFFRDLRYAFRMLLRNRSLTAIVALSLGLGIGLNTAVFSFVDAVLLHPFPYSQPEKLVFIWGTKNLDVRRGLSGETLDRWQSQSATLEKISPFQLNLSSVSLDSGGADTLQAAYVGTEIFSVLGAHPIIGRTFSNAEEETGADKSVILSYGLWQSRFGGDKNIIGTTARLSGEPYTVLGVMPQAFFFPDQDAQLWIPLTKRSGFYNQVHGLGRLRPNATLPQAQAELDTFVRNNAQENGDKSTQSTAGVFRLYDIVVGKYQLALWTLLGAVTLLVLLACANVANLLLARGVAREKELAVRAALGAGRAGIFRQLLTESLVLALFANCVGLLAGFWAIRFLRIFHLSGVTGLDRAAMNYRVLLFSLALSLLAGLISGIMPAWKASSKDLHASLQQGSAGTTGRKHGQLRNLLVSLEVAFAIVLLVSAGLLVNSFERIVHASWGFNSEQLLLVQLHLPQTWKKSSSPVTEFAESVLLRLKTMPGVSSAAMAGGVPIRYSYRGLPLVVDGKRVGSDFNPAMTAVSHDYFRAMGIPLLRGREFTIQDDAQSKRVVVISRALAEKIWQGQDPIGKSLVTLRLKQELIEKFKGHPSGPAAAAMVSQPSSWESDGGPLEVIGEVGDVRMFGLEEEAAPALYEDYRQVTLESRFMPRQYFIIRTTGDSNSVVSEAKTVIQSIQPAVVFEDFVPMQDLVSKSVGGRGSNKLLLVISILFGSLSLFLAAAGIYGVVSHSIVQRTREIGIRMALGADARDIVRLVMTQGMRPVLWGASLGLVACWAITRFFKALMFGITPTDPLTFSIVSALLLLVSLCACLIPSIRTMNTNPVEALRHE